MRKTNVRYAQPQDMDKVRHLCRAYRQLLVDRNQMRPEIVENYYKSDAYEDLLKHLPALHARPDGAIYVGTMDDQIVACGMTHRIDDQTTEIKRVFVDDAARGLGLGRDLFRVAMKLAKADGYDRMVLDTMKTLTEAIGLYKKLGFQPCQPFYDLNPDYADHILFFEARL